MVMGSHCLSNYIIYGQQEKPKKDIEKTYDKQTNK